MRRYSSILVMLACVCCANAQTQTKKYIKQGNKLYEEKKYKDAASAYQQALKKNPSDSIGLFNLGNSLYQQKQYDAARKMMGAAAGKVQQKDARSAALYNAGNTYMAEGKWQEAAAVYKQALKNNPQDADAKYNLSYALEKLKTDPASSSKSKAKKEEIVSSEFAKKLKKQAEVLIDQRKYADAYNLMTDGLEKDKTVAVFSDFIQRTKDIVEITK